MITAPGDDLHLRHEAANGANHPGSGTAVWNGHHHHGGVMDTGMVEHVGFGSVAQVHDHPLPVGGFQGRWIQFDEFDSHALLLQSLGDRFACRSETDDKRLFASAGFTGQRRGKRPLE